LRAKAILSTLKEKIKVNDEQDIWRDYMARCAKTTAKYFSAVFREPYISLDFFDIIHGNLKPQDLPETGEATSKIRAKLR
jgi:hypothetical protein